MMTREMPSKSKTKEWKEKKNSMMLKDKAVLMIGDKVYPTPMMDTVEAEDMKKEILMWDMVDIIHAMD